MPEASNVDFKPVSDHLFYRDIGTFFLTAWKYLNSNGLQNGSKDSNEVLKQQFVMYLRVSSNINK